MATELTIGASLAGGGLIGLAAVMLMLVHGRIAGATGVLAGALLPTHEGGWAWRVAMIAGMVTAPILALAIADFTTVVQVPVSSNALIVGGLIVGAGVTFGGGCTSGHGVCGMARASRRSLTATLTFMVTCAATVFFTRHIVGA